MDGAGRAQKTGSGSGVEPPILPNRGIIMSGTVFHLHGMVVTLSAHVDRLNLAFVPSILKDG